MALADLSDRRERHTGSGGQFGPALFVGGELSYEGIESIHTPILTVCGQFRQAPRLLPMVRAVQENTGVKKKSSRQILAENLDRLMAKSADLKSNAAVGRRAKPKIAHSHVRRIRIQESAATIDILDQLAEVFDVHPFELLTDGPTVRQAALERLMWGDSVPDPVNKPDLAAVTKRRNKS